MKKDINQALTVVYRGLAVHKKSKTLCLKAVDLELKNVSADPEVQKMCARRIDTIVSSIKTETTDYKCLTEILEMLTPNKFTADIQRKIVNHLMEKYKDEECVWQIIAEREFAGEYFSTSEYM